MAAQAGWKEITQRGVPQFEVARRPLVWFWTEVAVGEEVPAGFPRCGFASCTNSARCAFGLAGNPTKRRAGRVAVEKHNHAIRAP